MQFRKGYDNLRGESRPLLMSIGIFEQLRLQYLKVQPIAENENVLEKDARLALLPLHVDELSQVVGDIFALLVDVLGPHQLYQLVVEK